jgi:ADP-ribose pyrophosphatase
MGQDSGQGSQDNGGDTRDREVFKGHLITVRIQAVPRPDGTVAHYEIVDHPDAVGIVAVREGSEGPEVALVRQSRPAINVETWEIPAGLVDPNEIGDPKRTAERELLEETGYIAGKMIFLHRHFPSPGFSNEAISIYLATELREAPGSPVPDPFEIDQLEWKAFDDALTMCRDGEIVDGKTVIGLWLARDALAI